MSFFPVRRFNASLRHPLLPQAALLALLVALGGCGHKGPLYLPSSPEAGERAPAPAESPANPDSQ